MTKQEVLSEIMYNLKFNDSVDFEADQESYSITHTKNENNQFIGFTLTGSGLKNEILCTNKTELRKAVSKLGKEILAM